MAETKELIIELAKKYGRERKSLLPILQGIVSKEHYLSEYALAEVAQELDLSAAQVYGTATFYSFLDTQVCGKYIIRICKTITCEMKGKNQIIKSIEDTLKIKMGETTANKMFTLLHTNCLGWCHKGPAMLINGKAYTELTPEKAVEIINEYMRI